jgi:hypothetical protein
MLEAATRRVHNTFGNRLNYSGNLPSYKTRFRWDLFQCYQQSGYEKKTKDRLMRLCLQVFTCRKNKESEKLISLEREDNIKLVEIDVEITKIDSFLKTIRNYTTIVAQMTERAIENNQEMKVLLSGIKLLS